MKIEISKRKLESYKRAEAVAQEARHQLRSASVDNPARLADFVIYWMRSTGNVKFNRPDRPKI